MRRKEWKHWDEFDEWDGNDIVRGGSWKNYAFQYKNPFPAYCYTMLYRMATITSNIRNLLEMEKW